MGQVTGRDLNKAWGVNAVHALYREDGRWYHQLNGFPGALFDASGYIVFASEQSYRNCPHLSIGQDINIPDPRGIASIPGYVRVK
jgi:5-methylcytosine-specific restriction protein A